MRRAELQSSLAINVGLISMGMLFATLFMGYGIYRTEATQWPPGGFEEVSLTWPMISTVILLISSFTLNQTAKKIKINDLWRAKGYLFTTLVLGLGFMVSQAMLWNQLKADGLYASSGIFASLLYAFTWIHAAHMIGGVGSLIYLWKQFTPENNLYFKAKGVEKFWLFLEVIWLMILFTLFIF